MGDSGPVGEPLGYKPKEEEKPVTSAPLIPAGSGISPLEQARLDRQADEERRQAAATQASSARVQQRYRSQATATRRGTLLTGLLGLPDEGSTGRKSLLGL